MKPKTAGDFGRMFVEVAQRETSRVGYRSYRIDEGFGIAYTRTGNGNIPYDTGKLQKSIYLARETPTSCTIKIIAPYAVYLQYCENVGRSSVRNAHKNFLQRFVAWEYANELRKKYPRAEIR